MPALQATENLAENDVPPVAQVCSLAHHPASKPNGPSPNTVLATQCDCPAHMSLEEYRTLHSTPLGYRLQWQKHIATAQCTLRSSVDFGRGETSLTVLQCIHQAGVLSTMGDVYRSNYLELQNKSFAPALIDGLGGVAPAKSGELAILRVSEYLHLASNQDVITVSLRRHPGYVPAPSRHR